MQQYDSRDFRWELAGVAKATVAMIVAFAMVAFIIWYTLYSVCNWLG